MDEDTLVMIWSSLFGLFTLGGAVGCTCVSLMATKLGRRGALFWNNALVLVSVTLMVSAKSLGSWAALLAGRFIIGVNCGIGSGIAPMYLNEISPVELRGSVGTFYTLGAVLSVLASQIMGKESLLGTESGWPVVLGITGVPAVLQVGQPSCR